MYNKGFENTLRYEHISIADINIPILVDLHKNNRNDEGCEFHWHEQLEFYYVLKGELTLNSGGKESRLYAGDIGYVGWGKPHRGSNFSDNTEHYIIQVDMKYLPIISKYNVFSQPSENIIPFIRKDDYLNSLLQNIVTENNEKKTGYELEIIATLLKIFSYLLRNYTNNDTNKVLSKETSIKHVHKILHFLSINYKNNITLDELAHEFGMSKAYMCRVFKKYTRLTIIRYINELKCNYAASLLLDGQSIRNASDSVGYNDYNYFSRVFKKIYGVSPLSYCKESPHHHQ